MAFGTVDLTRAEDWNPVVLLGLIRPRWPVQDAPRVRIGDVAFTDRMPNGTAHKGTLVIVSVDAVTGQAIATATERPVPAWTSRGERSLTSGCVLVHRAHRLPALIITDDDANNVYSSQFIPIRADQSQLHPAYLWALLTSRSGSESRQRLSLGLTGTIGPSDLANLEIPVPALAEQRRIAVGVQPIIDGLGVRVERPAQSWSKTADLRSGPGWDLLVKFRDISVFNTGTPLGDLAQVRRGDIGRRDFLDRPLPGWFPVIDANSIRDPRATRWAEPDQGTIGPGDIVIPPNPDLDAVAVAATSVAGNNTVVVTANEDRDNMRIVGSLNSATGRDLRRALSVHGVMLRPTDARRIPIYDHPEPAALIEPIGQRLEALLWP